MELTANHITLRGSLASLPQFSHENHGRRFFRFPLEVPRLSGAVDVLPVIAREDVLCAMELSDGEMLTVTGQIRSHNLREDGKRRLLIFFLCVCLAFVVLAVRTGYIQIVKAEEYADKAGSLLTGKHRWAGKSATLCWLCPEPSGGRTICPAFSGAEPHWNAPSTTPGMCCASPGGCRAEPTPRSRSPAVKSAPPMKFPP